jgi:hypothetical protein
MIRAPARSTRADTIAWWTEKSVKYPFHALSPTSVRPELVAGDHVSCVLRIGWRQWGFPTAEARDAFCAQYTGGKLHVG